MRETARKRTNEGRRTICASDDNERTMATSRPHIAKAPVISDCMDFSSNTTRYEQGERVGYGNLHIRAERW